MYAGFRHNTSDDHVKLEKSIDLDRAERIAAFAARAAQKLPIFPERRNDTEN